MSRRITIHGSAIALLMVLPLLVATQAGHARAGSIQPASMTATKAPSVRQDARVTLHRTARNRVALKAKFTPVRAGRRVALQVLRGSWHTVARKRQSSMGRARFKARSTRRGKALVYRVKAAPYRKLPRMRSKRINAAPWLGAGPGADLVNRPAQAAGITYGASSGALPYAHPGGLVVAGRDNYADAAFKKVSAAGGTVLIYLDPVIDNAYGRYHRMLLEKSACGPATARWPGNHRANTWGYLNDFRPGSVLQDKLECVLETMVDENPHMAGWFADDVGSRSWFPELDWRSFPGKQAYREGAIALTRTFRKVADRHGLIFLVNGTWSAGDGGGYPDADRHGNALADGGFVEHHDGQIDYFGPYGCSDQWAAQSPVTRGKAFNYAVTSSSSGLDEYVDSNCYAYVNKQSDYGSVRPWGDFHPTGLPSRVN